jgi:hypothetical protein
MGRIAGWLLLALAAFMFIGYLGADVTGTASLFALLITVVLPAVGGVVLVRGGRGDRRTLAARREALRQDTVRSEVLRLAGQHGGRITIVEVVTTLAITPDEAKNALDSLSVQGLADFEVTDSGVVVYVFHDVQRLDEKHQSRGLLE